MDKAYNEVKLCVENNKHNLSTETLQLCLEALRITRELKHNGYSNYPTWLLASHIDNTEYVYKYFDELRTELQQNNEAEENAVGVLAQTMQHAYGAQCMKLMDKCTDTIWSSILNDALCSINFMEIAKTFYNE